MFHKHKWREIARTYAEPRRSELEGSAYLVERVLFGVTTILWECEICQRLRKEEMLGKEIENG